MKKLLLTLALFPLSAFAEFLPAGCYVADYYRNDPCWSPGDLNPQWTVYASPSDALNYYGFTLAYIIKYEDNERIALGDALNSCNANASANESNRQEWIAYGNSVASQLDAETRKRKKSETLVSKLRKACGSKCKKIK